MGPGPYLIPSIMGCICLDVTLATASLFPFPFYDIGRAVVVPVACHSALAVVGAALIFPSTITAQYAASIGRVLDPVEAFLAQHRAVLRMETSSEAFADAVKGLRTLVDKAENGMAPTAVWLRSLKRDVVWGRFAPADIATLQWSLRRIVTRAEGMNIYFGLIDPTRERFPVTPAPTVPNTPVLTRSNTPVASRSGSPVRGRRERSSDVLDQVTTRESMHHRRKHGGASSPLHAAIARHLRHLSRGGGHGQHKHSSHHDNHLHLSLLELAHALSPRSPDSEGAVGVFESQRYIALEETRLSHAQSPEMTAQFTALLSESCDALLETSREGLLAVKEWVTGVRRADWGSKKKVERVRQERLKVIEEVRDRLENVITVFRKDKRYDLCFFFLFFRLAVARWGSCVSAGTAFLTRIDVRSTLDMCGAGRAGPLRHPRTSTSSIATCTNSTACRWGY